MFQILTYKEVDYCRPPLTFLPGDTLNLMCIDIDYYVLNSKLTAKDE